MPDRRVVVTRPEADARPLARDLALAGLVPIVMPLIEVAAVADQERLIQAWRGAPHCLAVMFVSSNAVDHFFDRRPPDLALFNARAIARTRAWATGPGTLKALLRHGAELAWIDAPSLEAGRFDTDTLWDIVCSRVQPGDRVLIVRGADAADGLEAPPARGVGRDWLAEQLTLAGAQVDFVVAYQRRAPHWDAQQLAQARLAASDGAVWLFSSAQAVVHLQRLLPAQDWSGARAVATHPRIAAAVRNAGFGVVCESRPVLSEMVASIESIG
ncbi:uroporphyrinogen-III synthase [Rhodoferax sp.]|uniref:uroporphyrinogen-III synthase n=1 Tax=Rhodoferax sp. TaxID=50421 RepID=UPI00274AB3BC|nr:uroporphyrinogen-III synthase [Rhodoferax sp.]